MARDDLFTPIHKALRKGLFDVSIQTGSTDWTDPADVERLAACWRPLRQLLHSHAHHEDHHIFRVLDAHDDSVLAEVEADHDALDRQLADLDASLEAAFAAPEPLAGLDVYRQLALFVAAYLPHIHREETEVMASIWRQCTDEEIAAARAGFMAEITPEDRTLTLELMLPAVDPATRAAIVGGVVATAPSPVADTVLRAGS
jgi:hypothetical protein